MSSAASTPISFASCAISSPAQLARARGETTTSSPESRSRSVPRRRPRRRRRRAPAARPSRQATAVPADDRRRAAGTASSRSSMRESSPRNSKRRNISRSSERSGGASTSWVGIAVELEVAPHRRELLRGARLVGELRQVLLPRRRLLLRVLEHRLERAVLRDQLPGGLVADAGDARDVVRGVALQPDEVRDLVRPDPVARLDAVRRVDLDVADAARRHHQADVLRDELERVAVGRDDARADPGRVGLRRERRDHVVRLPALELEVAVAERLDDRPEVRELLAQQVGHRLPALLVDDLDRLGGGGAVHRPRVPGDRDALRLVVGEELEQHVREPEQRARREALGGGELLRQREEGAVGEVVAVDEEELRLARGRVVEVELEARQRLRRHLCESTRTTSGSSGTRSARRRRPAG